MRRLEKERQRAFEEWSDEVHDRLLKAAQSDRFGKPGSISASRSASLQALTTMVRVCWATAIRFLAKMHSPPFGGRGLALSVRQAFAFKPVGWGDGVVLLPTANRYDALAVMETSSKGTEYQGAWLSTHAIAGWLIALEDRHPYQLTTVGHDCIGGAFLSKIQSESEIESLGREMYDLAEETTHLGGFWDMIRNGRFFLWWD